MLEYTNSAYRIYLEWLFDKIKGDYYENLLYELWQITYAPVFELDENWAHRGLKLREEFVNATNAGFNCPGYGRRVKDKKKCSVLEMLVSLSLTAAESVGDGTQWSSPSDWFHAVIENLGLTKATNSDFDIYKAFVWREMDNIMSHNHGKLGDPYNWFVIAKANLGKLSDPETVDFRKMDIWNQLLCWIRSKSDCINVFERENVLLDEPKKETEMEENDEK